MKIYKYILAIAFGACVVVSCDKIDKDEYLIKSGGDPVRDSTNQYVLVEDFTGQGCVNCPDAALKINSLIAVHGERIVVLAEHVDKTVKFPSLGSGDPLLISAASSNNFKYFDAKEATASLPVGVIQRKIVGSGYFLDRTDWTTTVNAELAKKPPLSLTVNVDSNNMKISVDYKFVEAYAAPINLIVLITQDSIIAKQVTPQGTKNDYVHNHVLRASVTGTSLDVSAGMVLYPGSAEQGKTGTIVVSESYSFPDDTFIKEHCAVVAIAVNKNTGEVLQCRAKHLSH